MQSYEAFMSVTLEKEYVGMPFKFPEPEIISDTDFMEEKEEFNRKHPELLTYAELYTMAFELAAKFGVPYFDNQLPPYRGAGEGISCYQCCAYNFSTSADKDSSFDEKMVFKDGQHFSMGAWQVVSLNCPRAAYEAGGDDHLLFSHLKKMMDKAIELFSIKRFWMDHIVASGRMPFATQQPKDPVTGKVG